MTTATTPQPATATAATARGLRAWNIAIGNFFFKHRNALFPALFAVAILVMRPRIIGTPALDRALLLCGAAIALAGQAVRLTTIGFEYIERGGKQGKVYASHLVRGGVYGLSRNPMYVGNAMIAVGMSMIAGAPLAYLVLMPLFLCIYQAIVAAEENYLSAHFSEEYREYCATVPRYLPSFRGAPQAFAGMRYNWKRALRQDLSTITGVGVGLTLLPFWRILFLNGWETAKASALRHAVLALIVLACYALLHRLKKLGRLA